MGYTEKETELATFYRGGLVEGIIPGTDVMVTSCLFHSPKEYTISDNRSVGDMFRSIFRSEEMERANSEFTYYIMTPAGQNGEGAIILLHGLNERSWNKYIQWGMRLAKNTGRRVILFPSAYHMNRSPVSWIDRHVMTPLVSARVSMMPDIRMASFVNVALSTRMTTTPQRFMLSGYQTVRDVAFLVRSISDGLHPGITGGGPVDIFAYSIGALATQVMMLSRPSLLPDESRIMLFCGGSTFNQMNGTSKFIMDSRAFERLITFYLEWPEVDEKRESKLVTELINETPEGEAFYAMTSLNRLKAVAGAPFRETEGRFRAVTFSGDRVISPEAVTATLQGADVEIWTTQYPFKHENPFPVMAGDKATAVDRTFDRLFESAASFLSGNC
jgi:hypothetical protein